MNGWSGAAFFDALTFSAGHNAAVVAAGAALLGAAAGSAGVFLFLRKRALLSDAVAHATLPGVALAFIVMASIGGDGRSLPGLLIGAAVTAALGLAAVSWMTRRTRLGEDAAIGAVLSVFYGLGVVLLTVIQTLGVGKPAGLETFLLGATAGMLYAEALLIAVAAALALGVVAVLRRPLAVSAFDPGYAASIGVDIRRVDLALMALVTAVVVIGLKIVGLIMVIALLIIPPVAARFWTERSDRMIWIAAVVGALSGVLGAAASAAAPSAPTGPLIVLICFAFFAVSLLLSPSRGVLAAVLRRRSFARRVHRRQGLLALARAEPIFDAFTLRVLRREGLVRADGVATEAGRALAAKAARDEKRWEVVRRLRQDEAITGRYDGLTEIEAVLTRDEIAEVDRLIGPPQAV